MHPKQQLSFAEEVRQGLLSSAQKSLPTKYLYDDVGSALFDAITALPEYGLTRADIRLLEQHSGNIAALCPGTSRIAELGSGNGSKTRALMQAFPSNTVYCPIDLSAAALAACRRELADFPVEPVHAEFLLGLEVAAGGRGRDRLLVAFLGSNIGNFARDAVTPFLREIHRRIEPGDVLLVGADLVKPVHDLLLAYDDPAGVTAAFNRNLLSRVNRQLRADFQVRCFDHVAVWNQAERRVEMHLRARSDQRVSIEALQLEVFIPAGETIWTESSHKFELPELAAMGQRAGFSIIGQWVDDQWPFAELLFRA